MASISVQRSICVQLIWFKDDVVEMVVFIGDEADQDGVGDGVHDSDSLITFYD